jgi:hypothetical protein
MCVVWHTPNKHSTYMYASMQHCEGRESKLKEHFHPPHYSDHQFCTSDCSREKWKLAEKRFTVKRSKNSLRVPPPTEELRSFQWPGVKYPSVLSPKHPSFEAKCDLYHSLFAFLALRARPQLKNACFESGGATSTSFCSPRRQSPQNLGGGFHVLETQTQVELDADRALESSHRTQGNFLLRTADSELTSRH